MPLRLRTVQKGSIKLAVECLKAGFVIALPTDTIYGLACDATNTQGIVALYNIKGRKNSKPIAISLSHVNEIPKYANTGHLPDGVLSDLLPGPVTVILSTLVQLNRSLLCLDRVGIRVPNHEFIRKVSEELGRPLALTSANVSGDKNCLELQEFRPIWTQIAALFDGGSLSGINEKRQGSTVVDLTNSHHYTIVREGLELEKTQQILEKHNFSDQCNAKLIL